MCSKGHLLIYHSIILSKIIRPKSTQRNADEEFRKNSDMSNKLGKRCRVFKHVKSATTILKKIENSYVARSLGNVH